MDVKQLIVRFLVWAIRTILQVQCNFKKIYFLKICLDVNTKTNVFENFDGRFSFFVHLLAIKVLKKINPSSRYNPKLVLGSIFSRFFRYKILLPDDCENRKHRVEID